jgi:pyruvate formate lyase activating enzyme
MAGEWMQISDLVDMMERDRSFYESTGGGVTLSGGEVLFNAALAITAAHACKERNLSVAIETSGFGDGGDLLTLAQTSDHILYDIKGINRETHNRLVGVDNQLLLENLKRLCETEALREKIVIRMPLVSGLNDSEEDLAGAAIFLREQALSRVDILPYHAMGISKSREIGKTQEEFQPPTDERLRNAAKILEKERIQVIILGLED